MAVFEEGGKIPVHRGGDSPVFRGHLEPLVCESCADPETVVGFPAVLLALRKVIHGRLPMRSLEGVLLKLKPAVDQAAEEPGVRFLESLRLHGDQRVEKVKAYGSNGVHHRSLGFIIMQPSGRNQGV